MRQKKMQPLSPPTCIVLPASQLTGGFQIGEVPARRDDIIDHPVTGNTKSKTRSELE
jgi:hypothetical protein